MAVSKLRFRADDGSEFPEWEEKKLGEMMNVTSVKRVHASDWTDTGVPFYRAREIVALHDGKQIAPLYISEDCYTKFSAISGKIEDGDLLVTNPNKFDMEYRVNSEFKPFKAGDTLYLSDGDAIKIKNKEIPIKEKPTFDLSVSRCMFAQPYDLTKSVLTSIAQRNMQSIQALSKYASGLKAPKKLTFADVGGQDDVINQLKKGILYPVKYPDAYENSKVNHGFIMYGPPGTGKTLIAQALANESNATFMKLNGLEMESKWVGES